MSKHHGVWLTSPKFGGGDPQTGAAKLWRAHELPGHNHAVVFIGVPKHTPFYNVLLETHGVMKINGLLVETLDPDNLYARKYFCEQNQKVCAVKNS